MIRVHFECMSSMPALILETTDGDEAAFLKVFVQQIKDGDRFVYGNFSEREVPVDPPYGKPYKETVTKVTLDLLPVD